MSFILTPGHVDDIGFWRHLYPEFSIEVEREAPRFPVSDAEGLLQRIRSEGYVQVPSVVPEHSVESVRRCIPLRGLEPHIYTEEQGIGIL